MVPAGVRADRSGNTLETYTEEVVDVDRFDLNLDCVVVGRTETFHDFGGVLLF